MKFSVIIPCYNTGLYLEKCLESILGQTYADWEVILVNDGSTDNTADIIKHYVQKNNRIKMFYQENQGASAARNTGIENADGDYIMFCDSDDWYCDETALEQIASVLNKKITDIVTFQYIRYGGKGTVYGESNLQYLSEDKVYTGEEYFQEVLAKKELYEWYPWLYAIKKELFIENNIKFNNDIFAFEEVEIIYQLILKARAIAVLKETFYGYRIGREGQLTSISKKLLRNMLKVSAENIRTVNLLNISNTTKHLLNNNFSHIYYMIMILIYYLPKSEQKEIFKLLNDNRYIINYTLDKKDKIVRIIIRVCGLHITAGLLYIRSQWKKRNGKGQYAI